MADFPALPLFTDAYMRDCWHLSDAEHGRYLLVLILIWQSPNCRIPNEPAWIAHKLRRSVEDYERDFAPIIKEFCVTTGNWLTQKRLAREYTFLRKTSKTQSDRAKTRWNKKKKSTRAHAGAMPGACQADAGRMPEACRSDAEAMPPHPTHTLPTPSEVKEQPTAVRRAKKAARLPEDWVPSVSTCNAIAAMGFTQQQFDFMLANMRDWAKATGKTKIDWDATFRIWARKELKDGTARRSTPNGGYNTRNSITEAFEFLDRGTEPAGFSETHSRPDSRKLS